MSKKTAKYWQERYKKIEELANKKGRATFKEVEPAFLNAQKELQKEIDIWIARLAKNNEVSISDAKKLLNKKELEEFKWDLKKYIEVGEKQGLDKKYIKQLENASARFHINRLEAMKVKINHYLETAFNIEETKVEDLIKDVYTDSYYRSVFEAHKGFNSTFGIWGIDKDKLDILIDKPWAIDGKNYSDRIWQSKKTMAHNLQNELIKTCILGKAPDETIQHMTKFVDKNVNNAIHSASRLIMTEQAYFSSQAQQKAFKDLDVEKYEIVATLDSKTSKICQGLDGKVFDMKDYEVGVTAPPFHVYCRTTTVPYFDDMKDDDTRIARDENGKQYYINHDMTYEEWKEKYGKNDLLQASPLKDIKNKDNAYRVNLDVINSKEYHDKFDQLNGSKQLRESLYKCSLEILDVQNGKPYESIFILDYRTGEILKKVHGNSELKVRISFDKSLNDKEICILHNHPGGGRFSLTDVREYFNRINVKQATVIGNSGEVHEMFDFDRKISLEELDKMHDKLYNYYMNIYFEKNLSNKKTLDDIYEMGVFKYVKR